MTTITEEAIRLQKAAHAGPIGKRQSSFELYGLLADCMRLSDRCKDREEFAELERLVRGMPTMGKGRWITKDSDEYTLVCRFVFPRKTAGRGELSNASRYAFCLREAAKRQIRSGELVEWLKTNGGINALYLARPLQRTSVTTKALRLTTSIKVPKKGVFTLTLRRTAENAFEVVRLDT